MKLVSQTGRSVPSRPLRRRPLIIRWLRARSGLERALFVKVLLTLAVAAIALYSVHLLAHATQVVEQSINP